MHQSKAFYLVLVVLVDFQQALEIFPPTSLFQDCKDLEEDRTSPDAQEPLQSHVAALQTEEDPLVET